MKLLTKELMTNRQFIDMGCKLEDPASLDAIYKVPKYGWYFFKTPERSEDEYKYGFLEKILSLDIYPQDISADLSVTFDNFALIYFEANTNILVVNCLVYMLLDLQEFNNININFTDCIIPGEIFKSTTLSLYPENTFGTLKIFKNTIFSEPHSDLMLPAASNITFKDNFYYILDDIKIAQ